MLWPHNSNYLVPEQVMGNNWQNQWHKNTMYNIRHRHNNTKIGWVLRLIRKLVHRTGPLPMSNIKPQMTMFYLVLNVYNFLFALFDGYLELGEPSLCGLSLKTPAIDSKKESKYSSTSMLVVTCNNNHV